MKEVPTFFGRVAEAEDAARAQQWEDEKVIRGLEGLGIGISHLKDGQTLYLSVNQGAISRFGEEVIAEIPSLKVLRTPKSLVKHIQDTTNLDIDRLEILEPNSA